MTIVATISLPRVWENTAFDCEEFENEYGNYLKYVSPEVKTAPLEVMQNLKDQIIAIYRCASISWIHVKESMSD